MTWTTVRALSAAPPTQPAWQTPKTSTHWSTRPDCRRKRWSPPTATLTVSDVVACFWVVAVAGFCLVTHSSPAPAAAHCISCGAEHSLEEVKAAVFADEICRCRACGGLVKPDIVFFGENLPDRFYEREWAYAMSRLPRSPLVTTAQQLPFPAQLRSQLPACRPRRAPPPTDRSG
jgi:hypothetical protein